MKTCAARYWHDWLLGLREENHVGHAHMSRMSANFEVSHVDMSSLKLEAWRNLQSIASVLAMLLQASAPMIACTHIFTALCTFEVSQAEIAPLKATALWNLWCTLSTCSLRTRRGIRFGGFHPHAIYVDCTLSVPA